MQEEVRDSIERVLEENGIPWEPLHVKVFSDEMPKTSTTNMIFYGSTTLMYLVHGSGKFTPGVYTNDNFSHSVCAKNVDFLVNQDAKVMTMDEAAKWWTHDMGHMFVKPDDDTKSFSGCVFNWHEFHMWIQDMRECDDLYGLSADTMVVMAPKKRLQAEWRLFIVDGKIISGTQYMVGLYLVRSPFIHPEVMAHAKSFAETWLPHETCVMDIGLDSNDKYGVVEYGCINAAGFYSSSIPEIVKALDDYANKA
jgi:hypothetical protein